MLTCLNFSCSLKFKLILPFDEALLYSFTTWKILEKPSYKMALTVAFIISVGLLMIKLHYCLHEITEIFTLIFLPPTAVFLLLIYFNYRISPYD